ncbi:TPA: hypothetical protein DIU22_03495 [Candidatus Woesebacteria bacterium]|nr:hypothetical protein [Candidatus Woesebacteria bacterium]HLA23040.1 hypothetical protein [Candidatus Nanoarchaeia archaeon]
MNTQNIKQKIIKFHDKNYKLLLLLPLSVFLLSIFYLFSFYSANNDFIYKDFSLSGGTSITIQGNIDAAKLENELSSQLENLNTREIYDLITREKTGIIIQTSSEQEMTKKILEDYVGYELNEKNSSFEFISAGLSENFYKQLIMAILAAFLFMGIVVFIIFRTFIPSIAVIISVIADIIMTLVFVDILGIKMSAPGLVAFLMLIGYSVDTDILLTNRILKRHEGTVNRKIFNAFKTGISMTATSILAILSALFVVSSFSIVLTQIFSVLIIGLFFDIFNTWVTNTSLIKWYVEKHEN